MINKYYELSYFGFNFDRKSTLKKSSPFSFMKGKHYTVNAASWKIILCSKWNLFFPVQNDRFCILRLETIK